MATRGPSNTAWQVAGEHPADRILRAQDVQRGSLAGDPPPTPLQVAAVLHALADHTHIVHLLTTVAAGAVLADPTDTFNPPATSVGRYFHGLADHIETHHQATPPPAPSQAPDPVTDPVTDPHVRARVAAALRRNLLQTVGSCTCAADCTRLRRVAPTCLLHQADGTTDEDSVTAVIAALTSP